MTVSDQFSPGSENYGDPAYPTVFGITFTPSVSGILIGLAGLGVAAWMAFTFVGPSFTQIGETSSRVAQKELDLQQKQQTVQEIESIIARVNQAKAQNADVRGLFSTQQALDTLLLDLNRIIVATNASLEQFNPNYEMSGIITDSSVGPELNNKLKRQVTDVSFEGNFNQTLQIMQAIDRLQTVLVVRDLKMELQAAPSEPGNAPTNIVTSSFKLFAYVPLTEEELAAQPQSTDTAADGAASPDQQPAQ